MTPNGIAASSDRHKNYPFDQFLKIKILQTCFHFRNVIVQLFMSYGLPIPIQNLPLILKFLCYQ